MTTDELISELNKLYEVNEHISQATTSVTNAVEELTKLNDPQNRTVVVVKTDLARIYHKLEALYDIVDRHSDVLRAERDRLQSQPEVQP